MKNLYIYSLILLILVSCREKENNQNKVEIINAKTIKVKYKDENNLDLIRFYTDIKNNRIKTYYFYPGNKLRAESNHCNGKLCDDELTYDSITGNILKYSKYLVLNDETTLNEEIYYDREGEVELKKSKYLSIISSKDTVSQNELFELSVTLKATGFPNERNVIRKLVIGEFDKNYNIIRPNALVIVPIVNDTARVILKLEELGNKEIKGFVLEKAILSDTSDSINTMYFSSPIYVKGKRRVSPINFNNYRFYDSLSRL